MVREWEEQGQRVQEGQAQVVQKQQRREHWECRGRNGGKGGLWKSEEKIESNTWNGNSSVNGSGIHGGTKDKIVDADRAGMEAGRNGTGDGSPIALIEAKANEITDIKESGVQARINGRKLQRCIVGNIRNVLKSGD